MKILILAFVFTVSVSASAKDWFVPKSCDPTVGHRVEFSLQLREKIYAQIKDMKEGSKEWAEFQYSPSYSWLAIAAPSALPSFSHVIDPMNCVDNYMSILTATEAGQTRKSVDGWLSCLKTTYPEQLPPMASSIARCFGATVPDSEIEKELKKMDKDYPVD